MADKVFKKRSTKSQRFGRLLRSLVDPRALAHGFKILNYYNYSHAAELGQAQKGDGLRISPTASFANGRNIVIKDRVHVGAMTHIWAGNGSARIVIGEDTLIAPGVMITSANYRFNDGAPINDQAMEEADVIVGDDVWIGYGAVVLPGSIIGDGAVIGAGAVIHGDIPERAIVSSQKGSVIGYRFIGDATYDVELTTDADSNVARFIRNELHDMSDEAFNGPVVESGIDSFDLIKLRTRIETEFDLQIPDRDWAATGSLKDIARLKIFSDPNAKQRKPTGTPPPVSAEPAVDATTHSISSHTPIGHGRRSWELTMPLMALSGLSESWLFKELGDLHWEMICKFLQTDSSKIADEEGDRLYATFTRISLRVDEHLRSFKENQDITLTSQLERYGAGFFFGSHMLSGPAATCSARTMSTFAKYGEHGKNTTLMKGTPLITQPDAIPSLADFPEFGADYRSARGEDPSETVFECDYEILASHDINGVGLLYFAAYPTIFDLCLERFEGKGFLLGSSTVAKDIMYFANSDPQETLKFRLHTTSASDAEKSYSCSLYRSSDGKRMASAKIEKTIL